MGAIVYLGSDPGRRNEGECYREGRRVENVLYFLVTYWVPRRGTVDEECSFASSHKREGRLAAPLPAPIGGLSLEKCTSLHFFLCL